MRCAVLCLCVTCLLCGCSPPDGGRELGDGAVLRVMGLDTGEEGVVLTVAAGGGQPMLWAAGASAAGAEQQLRALSGDGVSLGHVEHLLVSEAVAAQGLEGVLDYLARQRRLGPGVTMWVVRDASARQLLELAQDAPDLLERLSEQCGTQGTASRLMTVLAREGSAWLPAIRLADGRLEPGGYGIIRQGRLVCCTDEQESRGLELLSGFGEGRVTQVVLSGGEQVSLRLDKVSTECRPEFRDGELVGMTVQCRMRAQLAQTPARLTAEQLQEAARQLELTEGRRAVAALACAQYWDSDFLGLERRGQLACPERKGQIGRAWGELFQFLDIQVVIRCDLQQPEETTQEG